MTQKKSHKLSEADMDQQDAKLAEEAFQNRSERTYTLEDIEKMRSKRKQHAFRR